jgi:hypothetical protein
MSTFYKELSPLQEPSDVLGLDGSGRDQFSFNVIAVKRPSTTFAEELKAILVTASVGVFGATIFISPLAQIPTTENDTAILSIRETGGPAPERTHNQISPSAYQRPTAQIVVRSHSYLAAKAMAYAAYAALNIRNTEVTP